MSRKLLHCLHRCTSWCHIAKRDNTSDIYRSTGMWLVGVVFRSLFSNELWHHWSLRGDIVFGLTNLIKLRKIFFVKTPYIIIIICIIIFLSVLLLSSSKLNVNYSLLIQLISFICCVFFHFDNIFIIHFQLLLRSLQRPVQWETFSGHT